MGRFQLWIRLCQSSRWPSYVLMLVFSYYLFSANRSVCTAGSLKWSSDDMPQHPEQPRQLKPHSVKNHFILESSRQANTRFNATRSNSTAMGVALAMLSEPFSTADAANNHYSRISEPMNSSALTAAATSGTAKFIFGLRRQPRRFVFHITNSPPFLSSPAQHRLWSSLLILDNRRELSR